jgi:Rps23 Pro-64 3,4-dihydroxylase Tpa1-like proline 4-hydroxylase
MNIINNTLNLDDFGLSKSQEYISADPFPHIIIDDLFNSRVLSEVSRSFPKSVETQRLKKNNNFQVGKSSLQNEICFSPNTIQLLNYFNSQIWLRFLNNLTGINEKLFPDPYYFGGGIHSMQRGGWLKIHSDFKKHPVTNLDRRLNMIIFLNENWKESYGGYLELWDKKMEKCIKKVPPLINKTIIFNTTDYSNHGVPDPLNCPRNIVRKSIALYYYTNGRPLDEINYKVKQDGIKTYWKPRKKNLNDREDFKTEFSIYHFIIELIRKIIPQKIFRFLFHK